MEKIELKNTNRGRDAEAEEESEAEKDEKDTGFNFNENTSKTLLDRVLEMDASNNLFVRLKDPSTSDQWDPSAIPDPKRDAGVIKRHIIYDKKQFILKVFGITVNKGKGPYSKILYDNLRTTTGEKSGKINGATYKGKKIIILRKSGRMVYSKSSSYKQLVLEFKTLLDQAEAEHNVSSNKIVEDHIDHEISEETVDNIRMKAANDMEEKADLLLDQAVNNIHITKQEISELRGVVLPDWSELIELGDNDMINSNLEALDRQNQNLKEKSLEAKAKGDTGKEILYETMAKVAELKADEVRTRINQKPKGNLAVEILKKEADVNEMAKFDKFKKWVKENMLGLSAVTITVGGILVTIFSTARTIIKGGANALGKFAKSVANIAKKFGPVIAAVGQVIAGVLSFMSGGLKWLAKNLWLLAVALTYFIYNEYRGKKRGKTTK